MGPAAGKLTRQTDEPVDVALGRYIMSRRGIPFKYGENDCLTFTNGWCRVLRGVGFADHVVGRYSDIPPSRAWAEIAGRLGYRDLFSALDDVLEPISSKIPPRGAIVATSRAEPLGIPYALGIAAGVDAAFIGAHGAVSLPLSVVKGAWICPK